MHLRYVSMSLQDCVLLTADPRMATGSHGSMTCHVGAYEYEKVQPLPERDVCCQSILWELAAAAMLAIATTWEDAPHPTRHVPICNQSIRGHAISGIPPSTG
jgi:hypothetical protein